MRPCQGRSRGFKSRLPLQIFVRPVVEARRRSCLRSVPARRVDIFRAGRYLNVPEGRGTQVVRERSAKPLCVGSIPTRASNSSASAFSIPLHTLKVPFLDQLGLLFLCRRSTRQIEFANRTIHVERTRRRLQSIRKQKALQYDGIRPHLLQGHDVIGFSLVQCPL